MKYNLKLKRWVDENGDVMRAGYGRWDASSKQMLQYNTDGTITHYSKNDWENKQDKLMKIRSNQLMSKRKQVEKKYYIPYLKDKSITISGNNKDRGAVISTNMLDSIAKYSKKAGIPLQEGLGLVAQESTFGNADKRGIGKSYDHPTNNGWIVKNSGYNGWSPVLITSDWDYLNVNPYSQHKVDKRGSQPQPYITINSTLKKGEQYKIDVPPLQHAFELYKSGAYNRGDKRHTQMVRERGQQLLKTSPEIQSWLKTTTYK